MSSRRLLANGALLTGAGVAGQALVFGRSVVLAHLISKGDMGIAILLQSVVAFFEMVSDLSTGTYLIQSPHGDDESLERTAALVNVVRGLGNTVLILLMAYPAAWIFDVPSLWPAFAAMAFIPLLRGFMHLDSSRLQRHHRFVPQIAYDFGGQLVGAIVSVCLGLYLRDYRAMLYGLIAQTAVGTIITQLLSERSYRLGWNKEYWRQLVRFGWPLLLNGILLFAILQGDRLVVGAERFFPQFTKADLAVYSVVYSLAFIPSMLAVKIAFPLALPKLSAAQADAKLFRSLSVVVMDGLAAVGGLMSLGFLVAGRTLVAAVYGNAYSTSAVLVGLLGTMQGLRLIRAGSTTVALARGDTQNSLLSNIARLSGFVLMLITAHGGGGIIAMAACGVGGEIAAWLVSIWRLRQREAFSWGDTLRPTAIACLGIVLGLAGCVTVGQDGNRVHVLLVTLVASVGFVLGIFVICPALCLAVRSTVLNPFQRQVVTGGRIGG